MTRATIPDWLGRLILWYWRWEAANGHLGAALRQQPTRGLTPPSTSLQRASASLSPPGRPLPEGPLPARGGGRRSAARSPRPLRAPWPSRQPHSVSGPPAV